MKKIISVTAILTSITTYGSKLSNDSISSIKDTAVQFTEQFQTITVKNVPQNINVNNNIPEATTDYLTTWMPIITLILGLFITKLYDIVIKRSKTKKEAQEWIENYIQLKDSLVTQIIEMKDYIPRNDENRFEIDDPSLEINLMCDSFTNLNNKSLVPYLMQGKDKLLKREAISLAGKMKGLLAILENTSLNYKLNYSELRSETSTRIALFNEDFNSFRMKCAEYSNYAIETYTGGTQEMIAHNKMFELIKTQITPFIDNGELDLFKVGNNFVKPFFEQTYIDRNNPMMKEITQLLNRCDLHIKALKMEKKYFRIRLEKNLKSYEKSLTQLNSDLTNKKLQ